MKNKLHQKERSRNVDRYWLYDINNTAANNSDLLYSLLVYYPMLMEDKTLLYKLGGSVYKITLDLRPYKGDEGYLVSFTLHLYVYLPSVYI